MTKLPLAILIGLAGICPAQAQQNPVSSSYMSFEGGLNENTASIYLNKNESPNLMNVVIDEPLGALRQRRGYQVCGHTPSGNPATNLYAYTKQDGSKYLIVTDNISVWQTYDCSSFTVVATGLSPTAMPRFATVIDNLWVVNGSTYPIVWDGNAATRLDGLNGRPLAPKAKYIAWWKNRVFLGRTVDDPSGVFFSAVVSPGGLILNPATSPDAWKNTNNLIYFSRDDGSPLYGIEIYRDNLYAFKATGIIRLVFESEYQLSTSKTVATIGSKFQDAITEMDDGLLRFVGQDGVYAFDGGRVKRISTAWTPTFYSIKQPAMGEFFQIWDSTPEFKVGTLTNMTADQRNQATALTLSYIDKPNWSLDLSSAVTAGLPGGDNYKYTIGWTAYGVNASATEVANAHVYLGTKIINKTSLPYGSAPSDAVGGGNMIAAMDWCSNNIGGHGTGVWVQLLGPGNQPCGGQVFQGSVYNEDWHNGRVGIVTNYCSGPIKARFLDYDSQLNYIESSYFASEQLVNNQLKFGWAHGMQNGGCGNTGLDKGAWRLRIALPVLSADQPKVYYPLSGTWVSQPIHATDVSFWKKFDAIVNAWGQTQTFEFRTATTQAGLPAATYQVITPGVNSSTTTNAWGQIRETVTTTDESMSPWTDRLSASWITGSDALASINAVNYKSRYWVAAGTDSANAYNTMVMVESKSPMGTYTKFDLPISAFAVWNNALYGAIGNTDEIALLDVGDLDGDKTITSYWDSRDEIYTSPVIYKSINRMIIDYQRAPVNSNLQIGLSNDLGTTFSYKPLNTGDTLLPRNTKIINMDANRTLQFRSRILNNTPGVGFSILGVNTFGSESLFQGN